MTSLAQFPAYIAVAISVLGFGRIYMRGHDKQNPQALSALVTHDKALARQFQTILVVCSALFAITMYAFVTPRITNPAFTGIAWTIAIVCALLTAVFPYSGKTERLHSIFGKLMAGGMLITAFAFSLGLEYPYNFAQIGIVAVMDLLVFLTLIDQKNFIYYEVSFILLSHLSILIAVATLA